MGVEKEPLALEHDRAIAGQVTLWRIEGRSACVTVRPGPPKARVSTTVHLVLAQVRGK